LTEKVTVLAAATVETVQTVCVTVVELPPPRKR
jgi:hypothetical protein